MLFPQKSASPFQVGEAVINIRMPPSQDNVQRLWFDRFNFFAENMASRSKMVHVLTIIAFYLHILGRYIIYICNIR